MANTLSVLLQQVTSISEQFEGLNKRMAHIENLRSQEIQNIKIQQGTVKRASDDHLEELNHRVDSVSDSYARQQEIIEQLKESNQKLLDTVTVQNFKLNATGGLPHDHSKYSLFHKPDVERWPLLKSRDPKHSFGKFQSQLSGLTLDDDSLASWEILWDGINATLMMVLQSNQLFPDYCNLDMSFSPQQLLIPPS